MTDTPTREETIDMSGFTCADIETLTDYLAEHAEDDLVLTEIIERIHGLTNRQFAESGTLPLQIAADLILGVWQSKHCSFWNERERKNEMVDACKAAIERATRA